MSLLIDLRLVPGQILKAVEARAEANRERLRRRQEIEAARRAAADGGVAGVTGSRGRAVPIQAASSYRPDEPSAFIANNYIVSSGHQSSLRYSFGIAGGSFLQTVDIFLASGDGAQQIALSSLYSGRRFISSWGPAADVLIFLSLAVPGNDALIFVCVAKTAGTATGYSAIPPGAKFVLITHTTVEEISLPGFPAAAVLAANDAGGGNYGLILDSLGVKYPYILNKPLRNTPGPGVWDGGILGPVATTPISYVATRTVIGGDRDALLAAAPGSSRWFKIDERLDYAFSAKSGTARPPNKVDPPGFDSGEWLTYHTWDGGVPNYCSAQLADWGYAP